ncbi:MOSC domain-containing protein [Streptomyces sp. NEAU-H22]|uniref:MOSC domain-containing protein n=1 Tax=unclassified Streptomyces TaxID=2593676 RepID=UPI00225A246A|nr:MULTISPECIES: MOSC domain-containing protein [unclassified Streptomyces]MCX3292402.1 MOSC domain-containing protein [Streptomyces sp. NEAU-H22]WMD04258.1 MOSC domain-containing protein [Streptomyces sp. FXY-T5]
MGTVAGLWRYPVKSTLGEALESVAVTHAGLSGDRTHAALDETGAIGSAKHPRKWGRLLCCRSRVVDGDTVEVELPDGASFTVGDPELDTRLSTLLGRQVLVSARAPAHGTLERAVPEYEGGAPDAVRATAFVDGTGEKITLGSVAPGTFFDYGRVHLVTTSSLARLRSVCPTGDFDPRRFRPNLVVDTGEAPAFAEDGWQDRRLRVGEALFRVLVPTPRCVVPTLGHDELTADPGIMRAIAREHRVRVRELGRLACLGVYLDVLEPGTVRRGDTVTREDQR